MDKEPCQLPQLPKTFTYHGLTIAEPMPEHIRQDFSDLEFLTGDILSLEKRVRSKRDHLWRVMMIWHLAGPDTWDYSKVHKQDFPVTREYEYDRTTLAADYLNMRCVQSRIYKFLSTDEGKACVTPEMASILGMDDPKSVEDDVERMYQENREKKNPSVEEMMTEMEKMFEEARKTEGELWQHSQRILKPRTV